MLVRRSGVQPPPDKELHGRVLRRCVMKAAPQDIPDHVWCLREGGEYNITEPRLSDIVGISDSDKVALFEQVVIGDVLFLAIRPSMLPALAA